MIALYPYLYRHRWTIRPVHLFLLAYTTILLVVIGYYFTMRSQNFILGLIALPFSLQWKPGMETGGRFAWFSLLFAVFGIFLPVPSFLYFATCFALLCWIEFYKGRIGILAVLTLVLASPIFQYAVNTFSFPIRLHLSGIAASMLSLTGGEVSASGNIISYDGHEFAVDPGCMGLKMMEASLLLGVILVGHFQKKFQRYLNWKSLMIYFVLLVILNIGCNLFRIVLLVHFNWAPGTWLHEMAGIVCLLVYVFVPSLWVAKWLTRRGCFSPVVNNRIPVAGKWKAVIHFLLFILICVVAWRVAARVDWKSPDYAARPDYKGYRVEQYAPGILKLQDTQSLVYIKYIGGFYDTDHNPMTCWKGSGFAFQQVRETELAGYHIYTAVLENGPDKMYTAWWYDNGQDVTIGQLDWRWEMMKGAPQYAVVNITCNTLTQLNQQAYLLLANQTLNKIIKQKK